MKAIIAHDAKDLRIEDFEVREMGPSEVLVRTATGGICGSDLHYAQHGGFGTVRIKEPMILGHEVSGFVEAVGIEVEGLVPGDLVAISPSRPCYNCQYCEKGLLNHCENMRFYGSAMPFPHIQGAFRERLVVDARQCHNANGLTPGEAAAAEPLSVGLHAIKRAGDMLAKRVLVTGCGPIGALAVLAIKAAGAAEIVVTDLSDTALKYAKDVGASKTINMATDPSGLDPYKEGKGHFDYLFECSGAQPALVGAIAAMRPRGVVMQLGLGGDMELPVQQITAKELDLRGTFRFHEEFAMAVQLMKQGVLDVKKVISHTFPLEDAITAFEVAADRSQAMKTQIEFSKAVA